METTSLNVWAIAVAALSNFLIGGLWYSPALFGKAWIRVNGFSDEDLKKGSQAMMFAASFVFCLLMAANLAAFLSGPETDWTWGVAAGVLAGVGWVALAFAVVALFERRPWSYTLIHGGYFAVSFAVMGLILGAWR